MFFSIERVQNLKYMAAEMIFIIFLIYRTFSKILAIITVHVKNFRDVNLKMEKNFVALFANFN